MDERTGKFNQKVLSGCCQGSQGQSGGVVPLRDHPFLFSEWASHTVVDLMNWGVDSALDRPWHNTCVVGACSPFPISQTCDLRFGRSAKRPASRGGHPDSRRNRDQHVCFLGRRSRDASTAAFPAGAETGVAPLGAAESVRAVPMCRNPRLSRPHAAFAGIAAIAAFNTNLVDHATRNSSRAAPLGNSFELLGVRPAAAGCSRLTTIGPAPPSGRARPWDVAARFAAGRMYRPHGFDRWRTPHLIGVLPVHFLLPINGYHNDVCVPYRGHRSRINQRRRCIS